MNDEQVERYHGLAHAIQSGVAMELNIDEASGTPKHLRTGLNLDMCSHGALVRLLIDKGVFTEAEYWDAVLAELEAEKARYEERLTAHYGGRTKVRLA